MIQQFRSARAVAVAAVAGMLLAGGAAAAEAQQGADTAPADRIPNPLAGTPLISPSVTGRDAETILADSLPSRSDTPFDWRAPLECLHAPGEPRLLPPCVPPPPCHPSLPPRPYDLVGVRGAPTAGPIYAGPCRPRTGSHDDCPHPHAHRLWDRWFDWFYRTK